MDHRLYITALYDIYGELLTTKQQEYFEDYYFNNLSLGEMALNYDISRNAIFKQIRIVVDKLKVFEDKLKFYEKINKVNGIIDRIEDLDLRRELENIF